VSTVNTAHEHDPNERTARPGNAHLHEQFHSQSLPLPTQSHTQPGVPTSTILMDEDAISQDLQDTLARRDSTYTTSTPGLSGGLTRSLRPLEQERLAHLDRLKFFLATAPSRWDADSASSNANPTPSTSTTPLPVSGGYPNGSNGMDSLPMSMHPSVPTQVPNHHGHGAQGPHPALNRFLLPTQEYVTCVLWNGLYHITGTDIVRALVFRFEVGSQLLNAGFGCRPVLGKLRMQADMASTHRHSGDQSAI
jgi:transcription factor STE12